MKIVINGRRKLATAIRDCTSDHPDIELVAMVGKDGSVAGYIHDVDVVLDCSFHDATPALVGLCVRHKKPMVIGTTGHSEQEIAAIRAGATQIPIVHASNFSRGANTLFWLTRKAAEILGPDFDLEVTEMHHRDKADAPSGTACTLVGILTEVRNQQFKQKAHNRQRGNAYMRTGRSGNTGKRDSSEIGVHSLRGGDVFGDHTVIFAANGERVELTHKVGSRNTFGNGALDAARWVMQLQAGLYTMQDVLGLSEPKLIVPLFGRTNSPSGEDG